MANEWLAYGLQNLEDLMTKRRKERMEQEQIARMERQQGVENQMRVRQLEQQDRQFGIQQDLRRDVQTERENVNQVRKAANLYNTGLPGEVDQPTADLLRGEGYGGILSQERLPEQPASEAPVGRIMSGGGIQYQQARAGEAARQAQATAAQEAETRRQEDQQAFRTAESEKDRTFKETLARITASGRSESTELSNIIKGLQADKLRGELSEADRIKTAKAAGRSSVAALASQIEQDPRLPKMVGPVQGRLPTVRGDLKGFDNDVARLKATLSVESREKLVGSGAISDFESKQLGAAVTSLDQATNEATFKKELQRIRDIMSGNVGVAPATANVGGKVLNYNPATGRIE